MAGETGNILFRKSAMKQISSVDELDQYVKVSNPSIWIILVAAIVLLGALLFWSITGLLPTTVKANGVVRDGKAVCYLSPDKVTEVNAGDGATVLGNLSGTVENVSATPLSSEEAARGIDSDYTKSELGLSDWNYVVTIDVDGLPADGSLVPVNITAEEVAPISYLIG